MYVYLVVLGKDKGADYWGNKKCTAAMVIVSAVSRYEYE